MPFMPKYTTADIRNIAITGGAGSGKTTLVENILHNAGVIGRVGRIEDGNTVSDYDELEKEFKHSLDSTIVHFEHGGAHINLIDTPGSPDFLGKSISAFPAVETVAVVIDGNAGVETITRRVMKVAKERNLPRMIVVNKIDNAPDLAGLVESIQEAFGKECQPINLPNDGSKSVVECFQTAVGDSDFGDVADYHTAIIDQVVEVDEELMAAYLEKGEVTPQQLHEPFEKALREGHLIPICFVAARSNVGVKELMDVFAKLCPNPLEGNPRPFEYTKDGQKVDFFAKPEGGKSLL